MTVFEGLNESDANIALCKWFDDAIKSDKSINYRSIGEKLNSAHTLPHKIINKNRKLSIIEFVIFCDAIGCDPLEGLKLVMSKLKNNSELDDHLGQNTLPAYRN